MHSVHVYLKISLASKQALVLSKSHVDAFVVSSEITVLPKPLFTGVTLVILDLEMDCFDVHIEAPLFGE